MDYKADTTEFSQHPSVIAFIEHDFQDMQPGDFAQIELFGYQIIATCYADGQICAHTINAVTQTSIALTYICREDAAETIRSLVYPVINAADEQLFARFHPPRLE